MSIHRPARSRTRGTTPGPRRRANPGADGRDIAYSLDIIVSDGQLREVEQIIEDAPALIHSRERTPREPGWVQLILSTDGEAGLTWLQNELKERLRFHLVHCEDRALARSRGGKTRLQATVPLGTAEDLALAYTPGVARPAQRIAAEPSTGYELTGKGNRVAIVTDGSAVLGLGNLGPAAALPVLEGKSALFAHLAGIDAVPLCLDTQDVDQIVTAITAIAPSFAGINLADISAPRCFEIEERLRAALDIPVIHDDQHGTAIVVLAALRNALTVVGKTLTSAHIVVCGAGVAGTAISRLLLTAGAHDVIVWAPIGILHPELGDQHPTHKTWLAEHTNPRGVHGDLAAALAGADAVIDVSAPGVLSRALITTMATNPIVFALATLQPEINLGDISDLDAVIATGRAEYPNQVTNALAFPGLFRGALTARKTGLTDADFVACAEALAVLVPIPTTDRLLPDVLDPRVVPAVAAAVQ